MHKSTLAEFNENKDWQIYRDFAQALVAWAQRLYRGDYFRLGLDEMVSCRIQFALDGFAASLVEELCDGKVSVTRFTRKVINEEVGMRLFSSSKMTKAKLVCTLAWREKFAKGNNSVTDSKRRMPDRSGDLVSESHFKIADLWDLDSNI